MKNQNLKFLNSLYQNTSMGISALNTIIPRTKDSKLKGELQAQLNNYHEQCENIRKQIFTQNAEPKDINIMTKKFADTGIMMSTMTDKSTSHIAEMMIQGTNMGIIDLNKLMNHAQPLDENLHKQANAILTCEQQYIDKLKCYL